MNLTGILNFESALVKGAQTQSEEINKFVASSLKVFIEEAYKEMAPSFIIVLSCRAKSPLNFFKNVLQLVFNLVYHMNVQLVYIDRNSPQRVEGPRTHNLILVDSYEAFLDIDVISYTRNYDTNEYYHIFLMQEDEYVFDDMKSIFSYCWSNHIVNCNIEYQNYLGELYLYTYFPFRPNMCGSTEPQLINQFIGDSWVNKTFFHLKVKNLHGCPLVAGVRHAPPFSSVTVAEDGNVSFSGFEVDLMKFLAKKMNFLLDIRTSPIDDRSYPLYRGPLKMVTEGTANIVFGFYNRNPFKDSRYSSTFPHYENHIVGITYLPAHALSTYGTLSFPFASEVWYAVFFTLAITIMAIKVMRKYRPQSLSTFSVVACALGNSVTQKIVLPHSVLVYIIWLWSSFIIRTIYSGLFFYLLRYQILPLMPSTIEGIVDKNYRAVMTQFTYNVVKNIKIYEKSKNRTSIVFPGGTESIGLLHVEKSANKNLYAVTTLEYLIYFMKSYNKGGLFFIIHEHIMHQQLCVVLAKHSFLIDQFNWEIMRIRSVGLVEFWEKENIDSRYFLLQQQLYADSLFVQDDLWGIYVICSVCYLIAFMILLIEMLSLKIKFLQRLFK